MVHDHEVNVDRQYLENNTVCRRQWFPPMPGTDALATYV